jgi:hypothetical protein
MFPDDAGDTRRQNAIEEQSERIMRWAVRLTALWLGVALAYPVIWTIFASDRTSWLTPNTMGDYFAGVSAPLAFGWLVTATFLQMNELKLSRIQLGQNGRALDLQAKELKATVDELARQTHYMKLSNETALVDQARTELAAQLMNSAQAVALIVNMGSGGLDRTPLVSAAAGGVLADRHASGNLHYVFATISEKLATFDAAVLARQSSMKSIQDTPYQETGNSLNQLSRHIVEYKTKLLHVSPPNDQIEDVINACSKQIARLEDRLA